MRDEEEAWDLVEDDLANEIAEDKPVYQTVQQFEDLVAWQHARSLTSSVFRLTRETPLRQNRGICDQIQRVSVSIMSNIAEGYERGSAKDDHRHLWYAKASCAEVRSLLYVALDGGFIDQETFASSMTEARRVARIIGGLRASIARRISAQDQRR
jgi:four helix bundle protein